MLSAEDNDAAHSHRAGHADGRPVPPVLDAGAARPRGARARLPAGAGHGAGRGPHRVPRHGAAQVGLVDARCPHRGADLFFGRNEEGGLRCVYHGWKFDAAGRCVDIPTMARDEGTARRGSGSPPTRRASAATWSGPTWGRPSTAAASRPGVRRCARAPLRVQEAAGVQLGAGVRGRARHGPLLVPAHPARRARRAARTERRHPMANATRWMRTTRRRCSTSSTTTPGCCSPRPVGPTTTTSTGASPSTSCRTTAWRRAPRRATSTSARRGCRSTTAAAGSTSTAGTRSGR